jgi:hypothetical protein
LRAYFIARAGSTYFFTTQRHTQLVCHQSDDKKLLIFSMLKRFAPALGRLEQPPRNYAAQPYAPDLWPALSEFDCGWVEFRVGVLTLGFDDLQGEIAGNE